MSLPSEPIVPQMTARSRLASALVVGVLVYLFAPPSVGDSLRLLITWDAFAFVYLALAWWVVITSNPVSTRTYAERQDPSHNVAFTVVLTGAIFSFFAAVVVLHQAASLAPGFLAWFTVLCLFGIISSWMLTHTIYGLHYSHLYYGSGHSASGLSFPGDEEPDVFDFIYFSFTVGMCFQVSDVTVTRRRLRRVVLRHSMLSYAYSTVIIAITINLVASRLG